MKDGEVLLIWGGKVLSADGWLDPGFVTVRGGAVEQVGRGRPPDGAMRSAGLKLDASNHAVMPGLVNGHTHFSQVFMRGLAAGRPLLTWLGEVIWPLQKALTVEDMRLAALLGCVENLLSGATTVVDHHKICATKAHSEAVCSAAEEVGIRLVLARAWADRGTNAEDPKHILEELHELLAAYGGSRLVKVANGPLTPWRCSPESLQATHALAGQYNAPTHIHLSETEVEVQKTLDETGMRPVEWLDQLGMLGKETQAVHGVWLQDHEIDLLAKRGVLTVHCPVSNAVLGSGIAPVASLAGRGVQLRLGTDGPASNDSQDLFETMKMALSLARAVSRDPMVLSPSDILSWATQGHVLGPGERADIILVDLDTPRSAPVNDTTSALVLSASAADVSAVIVDGEIVVRDRQVKGVDQDELLEACRRASKALMARAGLA